MKELSLHILELAINSIDAGAKNVNIEIGLYDEYTTIVIEDDGKGMSDTLIKDCLNKGCSTKHSSGLGLYELHCDVIRTNGDIDIISRENVGTRIYAKICEGASLDNMGESIATILSDDVDIAIRLHNGANLYNFDTHMIKDTLNGVSIQSPSVIVAIKKHINEKILEIGGAKL